MNRTWISHHAPCERMSRHRHVEAYAALILAGEYVEAGDSGRMQMQPGQVVLHGAYEAHQNHFSGAGAVVLNIPLTRRLGMITGIVADADAVARLAERDVAAASALLSETTRPLDMQLTDWPDQLAAALASEADFCLTQWADGLGLAPPSLSRGFQRAYGVSPKRYRFEQRTLRAVRRLRDWHGTLAALAVECGFADQAHLSRAIVAVTGVAPQRLRVKSVQEGTPSCS